MPDLKSPFAGALSAEDAARLSKLLDAVSSPARLRIVSLLAKGAMTGLDMQPLLGLTQPTVSHHLHILEKAGLVRWQKRGSFVDYWLDREAFADLSRLLKPARSR